MIKHISATRARRIRIDLRLDFLIESVPFLDFKSQRKRY